MVTAVNDSNWICKKCGSDDIVKVVEIRYDGEIGGQIVEHDGRPTFRARMDLPSWEIEDAAETVGFACVCGEMEPKLKDLVVRRRAFNEMQLPCGRCDHGVEHHPQISDGHTKGFTRPLMPCIVTGCDCHDYYDQALGLTPVWNNPNQEAIAA